MKKIAIFIILFMPFSLIGQSHKDQSLNDYHSIQLDKAYKTKRLGKTLYAGGFFVFATGASMVYLTEYGGPGVVLAGAGVISWVAGAFVMAHANSEIEYYGNNKVELFLKYDDYNIYTVPKNRGFVLLEARFKF